MKLSCCQHYLGCVELLGDVEFSQRLKTNRLLASKFGNMAFGGSKAKRFGPGELCNAREHRWLVYFYLSATCRCHVIANVLPVNYHEKTEMLRTISLTLAVILLAYDAFANDATQSGKCTIVNPKDQPVVIGIYRPSEAGIEESLVAVPAKTQIDGIPVTLSDDEQFVIAYKAVDGGNGIKRAIPIKIFDYKRINFIDKKRDADTPDVLIEYHGFNETFGHKREGTRSLYIPDTEGEAKRVIRDSNRKSTIVEAPLAKSEYTKQD